VMEAMYPGTCPACTGPINPGEQIKQGVKPAEHEVCPTSGGAGRDENDARTDQHSAHQQPDHGARPHSEEVASESVQLPPPLPAGATGDDLRRWLREVEAQELAAKRAAQAQARAAKRDKHLEKVRPARSKLVEELFAYHGIAPIERDRNESQRLAALRAKAMGDGTMMQRPEWFDVTVAERIQFAPKAKQGVHDGDAGVH